MERDLSYIVDTCILIDYLRGEPNIYEILVNDKKVRLSISTVTIMELLLGALNKREVNYIQKAFKDINVIYINEDISKIAEDLMVKYTKSHNLQIDDALIAATSITTGTTLITYNISDFRYIPGIRLYRFITNNL